MRILLVVSVALIGLFADQSSLFATLVYRYEYAASLWENGQREPYLYPQGSENSAYIDFIEPSGQNVPITEAIYDFQFVTPTNPGWTNGWKDFLPPIPGVTYSSLNDPALNSYGFMNWGLSDEGHWLGGNWSITYQGAQDYVYGWLISNGLQNFWPATTPAYSWHENGNNGHFIFTGIRNVPEAGSTLVYLAIGMIILSSAGIKGLVARKA